jgi:hypothetical protein
MLHFQIVASLAIREQRGQIAKATALLSLIVMIPSLSSAAIYKCTTPNGGITYTDVPCAPETKTQKIDPAQPQWLIESTTINTAPAVTDANSQSQPEVLATLCAIDEFSVWLKAQRRFLPERDVRTAKFIRFSKLCRSALHLPDVAASVLESSPKPILASTARAE